MPYKSEKGLGEKQEAILNYIREYHETSGHSPSVDEIVLEMGITPISLVNNYLYQLERAGYIEQNRFGIKLIKPMPLDNHILGNRKLRIFLCHASQDKPIVRELYQRLLAEGWIDPWLDKEKLLPGQEWELKIEESVETADVVIICLSKSSVEKEGYYQKEIKKILDVADEKPEGTIFIIPLRLDNCQVPHRLSKWQYEDYFPPKQRRQAYGRLLQSLRTRFDQVESRSNSSQQIHSSLDSFSNWDDKWFEKHHLNAEKGMKKNGIAGFFEVKFTLNSQILNLTQSELLSAARKAEIHPSGWPIGLVLGTPNESPKPQSDGIVVEIELSKVQRPSELMDSYDYWAMKHNGDFYLLKSLFEDSGLLQWIRGDVISFNTCIQTVTETLLYCKRLYSFLGVHPSSAVQISIKHGGLKNRQLSGTRGLFLRHRAVCVESETEKDVQVILSEIETNLVSLVKEFTQPLFLLFDFQEFDDSIYENIVSNFAKGKIA